MKKISITIKLALIFLCSIACIIFSMFIFQTKMFNDFYMKKKVNNLIININELADNIEKNKWKDKKVDQELKKFSAYNNAEIHFDDNIYINSKEDVIIEYTGIQKDGKFVELYFDLSKLSINKLPNTGKEIYIEGDYVDGYDDIIEVKYIGSKKIDSNCNYKNYVTIVEDVNDTNSFAEYDNNDSQLVVDDFYDMDKEKFFEEIAFKEIQIDDSLQYSIFPLEYTNYYQIFLKKKIETQEGIDKYLYVNVSFQNIQESLNVLKEFYIFFYILAFIIIVFISYIISKFITKPILKMVDVAENIANMNFDKKVEVNSKDELGILSKSINTISDKLSFNIRSLKKANIQLRKDIEKEKKQDEIRREFIANASHELKTPLGVIRGFTEAIGDNINEDKKEYYIKSILDEIEKMNELVLDMLELSKVQLKNTTYNFQKINIERILKYTLSKLEVMINNKNIKVNIYGDYDYVYVDSKMIQRVLINVLVNAIKNTSINGNIYIKAIKKNDKLSMYIYNEGNKINKKDLNRVWDKFYKGENSINNNIKGNGLGLSIVKMILDIHKSKYGIRNFKKGVVFYFTMNLED